MSMIRNAREFPFYQDMGIDLNALGCVMLDTDSPINGGFSGVDSFHVTVRYGFITPPVEIVHIKEVLSDFVVPQVVTVIGLDVFPINPTTEVIVALVESLPLRMMNKALGVLPNIATFPEYKPHITIGYTETGTFDRVKFDLQERLKPAVSVGNYSFNKVFD